MESRTWHCTTCGDERDFLPPPCVDGHTVDGGDCPEWACTGCGAAVFVGAVFVGAAVVDVAVAARRAA